MPCRMSPSTNARSFRYTTPERSRYVHASRTPGHPPALLQALELALAGVLGLAFHKVIVVVLAPGADKERSRKKRSRSGAELLDLGDRVGQGRGVNELLSVEPVSRRQSGLQLRDVGLLEGAAS